MDMPDRIYAERDTETNEKRWYSTKGMGVEYVRAEPALIAAGVAARAVRDVGQLETEVERLREAMHLSIKIIDANLYHQREKVRDASSILKQALDGELV